MTEARVTQESKSIICVYLLLIQKKLYSTQLNEIELEKSGRRNLRYYLYSFK